MPSLLRRLKRLPVRIAAGELEVIVVDNASVDGTTTLVREQFPWVRVIESGSNLGFGRGCNLGVQAVTTPYVLLLNPDAVLPKESLEILIAFMDSHPTAAIAAPATWYNGTELQAAGGLPDPWQIILAAAGLRYHSKHRQKILPGSPPFRTDWLGGAIMLIRSNDFRKLGGFDPRFFLYFEETDLCRRALSAGLELWAVGEATAHHLGATAAKSSGQRLVFGEALQTIIFAAGSIISLNTSAGPRLCSRRSQKSCCFPPSLLPKRSSDEEDGTWPTDWPVQLCAFPPRSKSWRSLRDPSRVSAGDY